MLTNLGLGMTLKEAQLFSGISLSPSDTVPQGSVLILD